MYAQYLARASLLNLTQISRTINRLWPTKVDKCPALAPAELRRQFIFLLSCNAIMEIYQQLSLTIKYQVLNGYTEAAVLLAIHVIFLKVLIQFIYLTQ